MTDLLKDIAGDGDLIIKNNDLFLGDSDKQHQEDLIMTEKGTLKQFPDTGVGARTFLENEDPNGLLRETSLQFSADGMEVKEVSFNSSGNIQVNADYK